MIRGPGADIASKQTGDLDEMRARVNLDVHQGFMRPELLNRIDETVVFHRLGRDVLARIVDIQLQHLRERMADREMTLAVTDAAKELIGEQGWDPAFGARPLKRTIQQRIENPLASKILAGEFGAGDSVVVDAEGQSVVFKKGAA